MGALIVEIGSLSLMMDSSGSEKSVRASRTLSIDCAMLMICIVVFDKPGEAFWDLRVVVYFGSPIRPD